MTALCLPHVQGQAEAKDVHLDVSGDSLVTIYSNARQRLNLYPKDLTDSVTYTISANPQRRHKTAALIVAAKSCEQVCLK